MAGPRGELAGGDAPLAVPEAQAAVAKVVRVVVRDLRRLAGACHRCRGRRREPRKTRRSRTRSSSGHVAVIACISQSGGRPSGHGLGSSPTSEPEPETGGVDVGPPQPDTASPSRSAPCSIVTNRSLHFSPSAARIASVCSARGRGRLVAHPLRKLHPRIAGGVRLMNADVIEQQSEGDQVLVQRSRLARLGEVGDPLRDLARRDGAQPVPIPETLPDLSERGRVVLLSCSRRCRCGMRGSRSVHVVTAENPRSARSKGT